MAQELIAAVSTHWGRGAVGIIRLSGPGAAEAAEGVFSPADGRPLRDHPPRTLVYGALRDGEGRVIDHILCTWSPAPHSYTGEETAELQCHGSPTVLTMALEALFARGARQALPGEFTKRAFLNGKLDLAQAEGVADLIDAETPAAVHTAAGQLAGRLSRRVEEIYARLTDLLAHFHAVLDYPDEDIDPFGAQTIRDTLENARGELIRLGESYQRGRYLKDGLPCAIVGRPNVGKSTLLNALLGYERAIVTDLPGTTRDTVEERCVLGGVLLRVIDTAGLRNTADPVERIGVERSLAALEGAALALVLTEPGTGHAAEDAEILARAMDKAQRVILLSTKSDLHPDRSEVTPGDGPAAIAISAKTGAGMAALEAEVARLFPQEAQEDVGQCLTNARQAEAARRALEAVESALNAQAAGFPPDAVLTDVEAALAALGELTGKSVREDVTARIFERFCVGK